MVVFSNIAQSSTEVMDVVKDCHQTFVVVFLTWCSGGVFVVFLWWCFCGVFKHRPNLYRSHGCLQRLSSNIAQGSTEVMAVFKDCHQTSPKVLLK